MLTTSLYVVKGTPKTCAGCGQPFVIRAGHSQAIVGEDGRLYCYGTVCEHDAFPRAPLIRKCA
jgi:hypothetical protein